MDTKDDSFLDTKSFQSITKALLGMRGSTTDSRGYLSNDSMTMSKSIPHFETGSFVETQGPKQIFKYKCWTAFQTFSGPILDNDSKIIRRGVHISNVSSAISSIMPKVHISRIQAHIDQQYFMPNKIMNWLEFSAICNDIKPDGNVTATARSSSRANTSPYKSQPFEQMLKQQSSVSELSQIPLRELSQGTPAIDTLRTSSVLKDAVCEATKNKNRKMRRLELISSAKHAVNGKKPHFIKPLEKQSIVDIVNPTESLAAKRKIARERRMAREEAKLQTQHRHELFVGLNRTVIACDKAAIAKTVKEIADRTMEAKLDNWNECREKEEATAENIESWRNNEHYSKSMGASTLRQALSSSSSFSRSVLEYEKLEKNTLKASRMGKLSEYTSYKVDVPEQIQHTIRFAKKFSDYKRAKEEAEDIVKSTLSRRIMQHAEAKKLARLKAEAAGGMVSIAPIKGEDYFEDSDEENDLNMTREADGYSRRSSVHSLGLSGTDSFGFDLGYSASWFTDPNFARKSISSLKLDGSVGSSSG
eukprot:gene6723-13620_t